MESIGDIETVTVHIKKIREKIELDTSNDAAVNVQNVIKEQPDNKSDVIQLEVTEPLDKGPLVLRSVKY